jgi:hypothetical protein
MADTIFQFVSFHYLFSFHFHVKLPHAYKATEQVRKVNKTRKNGEAGNVDKVGKVRKVANLMNK